VASSPNEHSLSARCQASLSRSRARRELARRLRSRRLRLRGGGFSLAAVALTLAVVGAGAAIGQSTQSSPQAAAAQGLLVRGSSGDAVAVVQRALGMPAGAIDGQFGPRTEANVRLFQQQHGLVVDGIVGPQTSAALGLAAPAAPTGSAPATPQGTSAPAASSSELERIAQCESGGNPQAIGGGGSYRGKYQFSRATWAALGGSGDPAAAPEAEQDRRAAMLYAQTGTSSWPSCG
jgi:peptidoglycan hydrolase-like protein with peptidoglycan-binding domain